MLFGVAVTVVLLGLFFVPLVITGHWINSMREEMKGRLDDIDSRLKAIEGTGNGLRDDLHSIDQKIKSSGNLWR